MCFEIPHYANTAVLCELEMPKKDLYIIDSLLERTDNA